MKNIEYNIRLASAGEIPCNKILPIAYLKPYNIIVQYAKH